MKILLTPMLLLMVFINSYAQERELYFVSSETTAMRSGPGTNFNVITQLSKGMKVDLISEDFGEYWAIQYRTMNGFVKAEDLLAVPADFLPQEPVAQEEEEDDYKDVASADTYETWETTEYETGETPDCLNISEQYDYKLDNYLQVNVSENTEAVVKLIRVGSGDDDEVCYRIAYVKSGDTFLIKNVPAGKYYLKMAYGKDWRERKVDGRCEGRFVQKPLYKVGEQILDFTPKRLAEGLDVPSFELNLDVSLGSSSSGGLSTDDISEKEFNN